jgi:uncharacterized protein YjiS (DUF1127 family)
MIKSIIQYVKYRRTVSELARLDSIQLRDIGLTRFDIKTIARTGAY